MRAPRRRGVVTPDLAQQAGVLPNCQRQHDRKESCSKHVMLAISKGKSCASRTRRDGRKSSRFRGLAAAGPGDLRNFAGRCRKFRSAIVCSEGRSASWPWLVVASQLLTQRIRAYRGATLATRHREGSALIPAPPDDVFAFVDDHSRFSRT